MARKAMVVAAPVKPLSAADAARVMNLRPNTVRKYCTQGARIGEVVIRLRCDFVGELYHIQPEWITEFLAACKAARTAGAPEPSPRMLSDEEATRQQAAGLEAILNM